MRTVYRYPIDLREAAENGSFFSLTMPFGAVPLHVEVQDRAPHLPSLWALVDTAREPVQRRFMVTGTGTLSPEPPGSKQEYVGTFQQAGFVWHIWEA